MRPDRDAHVLQDAMLLLHGLVVHGHARLVDDLVHNAEGIRLRRPLEVVDRLRPVALTGRVDLVDRDHLAWLRIGEQILVVKAPPGGRVTAEALTFELWVRARPW